MKCIKVKNLLFFHIPLRSEQSNHRVGENIFIIYIWQRTYCSASSNAVKDIELSENSHNASGNKNGKPLWEIGCQFLINDTFTQHYISWCLSKRNENVYQQKPSRRMLLATLFVVVKTGNCPDVCSSVGGWINKLVYSYKGLLFSKRGLNYWCTAI